MRKYPVWFSVTFVLGLIIIIWGAITPSLPLIPGDIWLLFPGFLMTFLGLYGLGEFYLTKRQVISYFSELTEGDKISLLEMIETLQLSQATLFAFITSLRLSGNLQLYYNSSTHEFIIPSEENSSFCSYCGEPRNDFEKCQFCGKELTEVRLEA